MPNLIDLKGHNVTATPPFGPYRSRCGRTGLHEFILAYPRMSMHEHAGGLGLRQWHRYAHTGFVGVWSLPWQGCMIPVCGAATH